MTNLGRDSSRALASVSLSSSSFSEDSMTMTSFGSGSGQTVTDSSFSKSTMGIVFWARISMISCPSLAFLLILVYFAKLFKLFNVSLLCVLSFLPIRRGFFRSLRHTVILFWKKPESETLFGFLCKLIIVFLFRQQTLLRR